MSFANEKANHAIECHVSQCNNHCGCEDYCTLDKVCIGTHEANPKMDQCTDCQEVNPAKNTCRGVSCGRRFFAYSARCRKSYGGEGFLC